MRALEPSIVKADVADEPSGLTGDAVAMGLDTAAAEIVPGTVWAP